MKNSDLNDFRVNYEKGSLLKKNCPEDPYILFSQWLDDAIIGGIKEPNAMSLATVDNNIPDLRIVLLKSFNENGFVFYTNFESHKGHQIFENSFVACNFFWDSLERQIKIQGNAAKTSDSESENYFHSRPRESQIGAWVSKQSSVIGSRSELDSQLDFYTKKFEGESVIPKPPNWGGYRIKPFHFEFWQGRQNRLHDRIVYNLNDNNWIIERLSP